MKVRNIVLITAGCCVVAGALISGAAAMKLQGAHAYEDKEVVQEITDKVTKIDVQSDYGDINILPSENDKLTVKYVDCEINRYDICVDKGTLEIKSAKVKLNNWRENWFDRVLNVDIHRHSSYTMEVRVPKNMLTDVDINADCGAAMIKDGKFKNINCELDYGGLKIHNVTADRVNIESDCGDVELNNVTADIKTECDFGAIRFDRIKGKNITLNNDYGDVKGTILGKEEDYTINTEVEMGDKNIQNRSGGQNSLNIEVDMGDVNVKFVD